MTMSNFNDTQNKQIVNTAIDEFKLNPLTDAIPRQVVPTIQPVFELKRKICNVGEQAIADNALTENIYTTPVDKDFFLCGGFLSVIKDATATSIVSTISLTKSDGTAFYPAMIETMTLTAQNANQNFYISPPVLVKRGTVITVTNSTDVGNVKARGCIWGYTEETANQYI